MSGAKRENKIIEHYIWCICQFAYILFEDSMSSAPNYQMIRVIGSGVFGKSNSNLGYVFEAEDRVTKKKYALKRIEKVSNQLSREY